MSRYDIPRARSNAIAATKVFYRSTEATSSARTAARSFSITSDEGNIGASTLSEIREVLTLILDINWQHKRPPGCASCSRTGGPGKADDRLDRRPTQGM